MTTLYSEEHLQPGIVEKPSANGTGTGADTAGPANVTYGQDGEPAKGWTVALADAIMARHYFAKSAGGELHYYANGRYHSGGADEVRRLVKQLLIAWGREDKFSSYRSNEVTAYIAADARELWDRPPAGRINVKNGVLDTATRTLSPHTPDWLSTIQLPIEYDPAAVPDQWHKRIAQWFPSDAQETPWELLAYLLAHWLHLQKAILLLGLGANGKSRFLAAVKAFLGAEHIASLSLQQIETSRWATHYLNGKLANICADLPPSHLEQSSTFKAITGGDQIPAEEKHGKMYSYRPFVRLVFSANQPPQSKDASRAFFRRWIVIPFDNTFTPAQRIPEAELDAQLADPKQLSGALNKALGALPAVERRGIAETKSMKEAHREFHEVTDPVEVWLESNLIEKNDPQVYVVKGDLCKAYNEAARANGWPILTGTQFSMRVSDWRPNLRDGQIRVANSRPKVWYGIGLKSAIAKENES